MLGQKLQRAVAQQEGVVQNLKSMIRTQESTTDTSEAVYQHTEKVLSSSLRHMQPAAHQPAPVQPAPVQPAPSPSDIQHTVQNMVKDTISKELDESLGAHERQLDAMESKADADVASKRAQAAAILEEAKQAASMLMEHARKEDSVATAAAAISAKDSKVLTNVGAVANAALKKLNGADGEE